MGHSSFKGQEKNMSKKTPLAHLLVGNENAVCCWRHAHFFRDKVREWTVNTHAVVLEHKLVI